MNRVSVAVIVLLGLLPACSSKDEGGKSKLATAEGFCESWAAHACNDEVVSQCAAASVDACTAAQKTFCESIVSDGKYSRTTATDCLKAVNDAYEDAELTPEERDTVRLLGPPCDKILSGSFGDGDACADDTECNRDENLSCIKKANAAKGECHVPVLVEGGHDCTAPEALCATGLFCDGEYCVAGKGQGAECGDTVPCEATLQCLAADGMPPLPADDGGTATGTCQPKKKVGEGCLTDGDCATRICTPRASSDTGVCAEKIPLSPSNPICDDLG